MPSIAFDIAFIGVNKQLDWNEQLFKNFNDILKDVEPLSEWGGSWHTKPDAPHFQLLNWKNYLPVIKNGNL